MGIERFRNNNGRIVTDYIFTPAHELKDAYSFKTKIAVFEGLKYFFKPIFNDSYAGFNEVLVSILARQAGIPCVRYDLAKYQDQCGVICNSVEEEGYTAMEYNSFLYNHLPNTSAKDNFTTSLTHLKEILKEKITCKQMTTVEANQMLTDHIRLAIFDIAMINTDRHNYNLLIVNNGKHYKLAKAFDNEKSFYGGHRTTVISGYLNSGKIEAIIKSKVNKTGSILACKNTPYLTTNHINNLNEIKRTASKTFKQTLNQLFKLNIKKAFETMEEEQKQTLPDEYKEWVTLVFEERLNTIKEEFDNTDFIEPAGNSLEIK